MEIIIAIVAVFAGSFIQSSIGFGLAIVAAPVLYFLNPDYVPAAVTLIALVLSTVNAISHKDHISLGGLKFALIGRVPGSIAGGLLLLWINLDMLGLWLGISVLTAVAVSLSSVKLMPTPGRMMVAGLLSGFMGTSSSIGGPPLALLLQHQDARSMRADLSAFFMFSCTLSLIVLATLGFFTLNHVFMTIPLLPASMAGFWLARRTNRLISRQHVRFASLFICTVSGVGAIISFWF